jgi:hypothetical protein
MSPICRRNSPYSAFFRYFGSPTRRGLGCRSRPWVLPVVILERLRAGSALDSPGTVRLLQPPRQSRGASLRPSASASERPAWTLNSRACLGPRPFRRPGREVDCRESATVATSAVNDPKGSVGPPSGARGYASQWPSPELSKGERSLPLGSLRLLRQIVSPHRRAVTARDVNVPCRVRTVR